jgi:glutamate-ammonia-ligase adenylyltransferase
MTTLNVKDLLLAARLGEQQVAAILAPYGIKDPRKADSNLQAAAGDPPDRQLLADILEELLICASQSADPDQAITYFERFARAALNRTRLFSYLRDSPKTLEILAKTLGGSPYMAEILIRDPQNFYWVTDPPILYKGRKKREVQRELTQTLRVLPDKQKQLEYLRVLKRREMLQIGVRDLLRLCSVQETLGALSVLAEVLISAAHSICARALRAEYGLSRTAFNHFAIIAMGKLGGGELNFSSDVDILYLYGSGSADLTVSAPEYYRRLSQKITSALNDFTAEGYVYRVDLRLRPEGDSGQIADSLDAYKRYYQTRMGAWERLALLKAWPVSGDRVLARDFLEMARPFIYDRPFDIGSVEEIRGMKRRMDRQMAMRQQGGRNVKLGTGGIREIELIAQSLQVRHGSRIPQIHARNTLKALDALCGQALLSSDRCEALRGAYIFLRDVENKLQMVHDAQTHSLPLSQEELTACSRRLGYSNDESGSAADRFLHDYHKHTNSVSDIFESVVG